MIEFVNAWLIGLSLYCALVSFHSKAYVGAWSMAAAWFLIGGLAV